MALPTGRHGQIVAPLEEKVNLLLLYEGWYDPLELKGPMP